MEVQNIPNEVVIDADLQDLIPQFLENRRKDIAELDSLLLKKDFISIAQLAHKIKGAAGGYGFSFLSQKAGELEVQSNAQDEKQLVTIVQEMKAHLNICAIRFVAS